MPRRSREVCTVIVGKARSGKSWARVRFVLEEFLPDEVGCIYSNLPLQVERIHQAYGDRIGEKTGVDGVTRTVRDRMVAIPRDVLRAWEMGEATPRDYFKGKDLRGCHIIIDEAHKYFSPEHNRDHVAEMRSWLGDAGHYGFTVELITQDRTKLHRSVLADAALVLSIVNGRTRRDPIFGVSMDEWYQVRATWVGEYWGTVWEIEQRDVDGRFVTNHEYRYQMDPGYFRFYKSANVLHLDEEGDAEAEKKAGIKPEAWESHNRISILWWFVRRNWLRMIFSKGGACVALLVSLRMGWIQSAIAGFTKEFQKTLVKTPEQGGEMGKPNIEAREKKASLKEVTPEDISFDDLAATAERAVRESREYRTELLQVKAEFASLNAAVESVSQLTMVSDNAAGFADGRVYYVDEEITLGTYAGQTLESVDTERGRVRLSDGSVLWLRRQPIEPEPVPPDTGIQEVLQSTPGSGESPAGVRDGAGQAPDDLGGRDANVGAGSLPRAGR